MVDFEGVDWIDEPVAAELTAKKEAAPEGVHDAKVISAEKYQSPNSGNWTVKFVYQIAGGQYKDVMEWFNLWDPNPESKKISNSKFTALAKAVGFKTFPPAFDNFIGKECKLNLYTVNDSWTDNDGNERTTQKNKISLTDGYQGPDFVPPTSEGTTKPSL
jgi:hypothetical protein